MAAVANPGSQQRKQASRNHVANRGSGTSAPGAAGRMRKSGTSEGGGNPLPPSNPPPAQQPAQRPQYVVTPPTAPVRGVGQQLYTGAGGTSANYDLFGRPTRTNLAAGLQPLAGTGAQAGWNGFGWSAGGAAPAAAGMNTASFDRAAAATAQNQSDIRSLLMRGSPEITARFMNSPMGQQIMARLNSPQGFSPEELAAQTRAIDLGAAQDAVTQNTRMSNALARSGFADAPAAAFAREQLNAGIGRDQRSRTDALRLADAEMRRADREASIDRALALLGMEQAAISDAANQIGQFQFPFLPPDMAGGGGVGGAGSGVGGGGYNPMTGVGGNLGGNNFTVRPGNVLATNEAGLLRGGIGGTGGPGSAAQARTVVGNNQYRAQTGQDFNRLWDGRRFYGFG